MALLHSPSLAVGVGLGAIGAIGLAVLRRGKSTTSAAASGQLWASPVTTCSRRAIAACLEAGVDFNFVPIHLPKVEHKLPAFVELNPYGKVPAWRDSEGFDLYESRAIMRHVCETAGKLIPDTAKGRAMMEQWLWVDQCSFNPAFSPIFYMKAIKKMPLDENKAASSKIELEATLDKMEEHLLKSGPGAFLAGDSFSLADLSYMCYFEVFDKCGLMETLDSRPSLNDWWGRCRARPAWQQTLSCGFIEERKLAVDPLNRAKPWDP